jgi:hypothetical protein
MHVQSLLHPSTSNQVIFKYTVCFQILRNKIKGKEAITLIHYIDSYKYDHKNVTNKSIHKYQTPRFALAPR